MESETIVEHSGSSDDNRETTRRWTSSQISRRSFLSTSAAAGAVAIAGCNALGNSEELIISSYGGAFDDVMETVLEDFEDETEMATSLVPFTTLAEIEAMSDDPDVDVALLDDFDIIAGGNDFFVELDSDIITRYDDQYDSAYLTGDFGISHIFGAYGIAYNADEWDESDLESWADLWNDEFQGELGIHNDWPHFMVMAARAWEGDETDMEPLWERLPELSDNTEVFYEEFAAPEQLFAQGQITIASWFDGRTFGYRDGGNPVEFMVPEEGAAQVRGGAAALQNTGKEETAQEFIDHLLKPEVQNRFAEDLYYGPTNTEVELSEDVANDVVTESDLDDLVVPDWEHILDNRESFTNNWQENI